MGRRAKTDPNPNNLFKRVDRRKSNSQIIDQMAKRAFLQSGVVACLARMGSRGAGTNWWQDKELMSVFENMYKAGVLTLPFDPVERIRWIAFLCIRACEYDGFAYGNLLIPLDYLPDDQLNDSYGISVLEDVLKLRRSLRDVGWNRVFGW
jgi:hypothetical protein